MRTEVVKRRTWPGAETRVRLPGEHVRPAQPGFPTWPVSSIAVRARAALQFPFLGLLDLVSPVAVSGVEVLDDLDTPVLFAANHTSHLDSLVVLKALPARRRSRVAVAAAADYFFANPLLGASMALLVNAFPFCRVNAAHRSLEHCAQLLHEGWSLLLYPEGTRSQSGELGRFKAGVGLLAVRYRVPVVPVHIDGLCRVLPKGHVLPKPGRVTLRFGEPLCFDASVPYPAAACSIEQAVRTLAPHEHAHLTLDGGSHDGSL